LGIVTFGEKAELIYPLEPPAKEKAGLKKNIGEIRFSERYGDMKAGLETALLEFNKNSDRHSSKMAVLIGDGKSSSSVTIRGALSELNKTLSNYADNKISVYCVVYGDGYLPIMRNIADMTKGRYFIAPNPGALSEILLTLAEKTQAPPVITMPREETTSNVPSKTTEVSDKGRQPESKWPLIFTLLSLALTLSFTALWIFRKTKRRLKPVSTSVSSPGFYNDFGLLLSKINERDADPEKLRLDIETCAAKMWNGEKETRAKYHSLINSVLLWIDHFEQAARENKTGKTDEWLFRKARRILEDEGIEEISVKRGDAFDGMRHKQGGSRPDELPKDMVVELLRKGYYIKGQGKQEDVIFRPAEVMCSSGPRS